ncbi:MAG: hypothetical protein ACR2PT_06195 [Endozoicomonas sp.]
MDAMKRFLICIGLLLPLLVKAASTSEPGSYMVAGLIGVTQQVEKYLYDNSGNDFLCGSLVVSLGKGWFITRVDVVDGSIQNYFQFDLISGDTDSYAPNETSTGLLHIRQPTGLFWYSGLYTSEERPPINFNLTVQNENGYSLSYKITKTICNRIITGKVDVEQENGEITDVLIKPSVLEKNTNSMHKRFSNFYTPAYVVIPEPDDSE